jgi:hypothetical protein
MFKKTSLPVIVFALCCLVSAQAQTRGPSTPEDRKHFVEAATYLEKNPLTRQARDTWAVLVVFLIQAPDISVKVCTEVFGESKRLKGDYGRIWSAATCRRFVPAGTCHRRLRSRYFGVAATIPCRFRSRCFEVTATSRRSVALAKAVTSHRTPGAPSGLACCDLSPRRGVSESGCLATALQISRSLNAPRPLIKGVERLHQTGHRS